MAYLEDIQHLNGERDHIEINKIMSMELWPFDEARATEIALLKTFAIPSIARILVDSGAFMNASQKRFDDTDLLLSYFAELGYDSPKGRAAIGRISRMHARYPITNDEMLYVLSSFVLEPLDWNRRYGWRPYLPKEVQAKFCFWQNVGRRLGIKDVFTNLDDMQIFYDAYEEREMIYAPQNRQLYDRMLPIVIKNTPQPARLLLPLVLPSVMSPRLLMAFNLSVPRSSTRAMVALALRQRSRLSRLMPSQPFSRLSMDRQTYPQGHTISELGT